MLIVVQKTLVISLSYFLKYLSPVAVSEILNDDWVKKIAWFNTIMQYQLQYLIRTNKLEDVSFPLSLQFFVLLVSWLNFNFLIRISRKMHLYSIL